MKIIKANHIAECPRIAIVVSRFNENITTALLTGALNRFKELEIDTRFISIAYVPGAVEIPIVAQQFAQTGEYDAILAIGAVIRGETSHYDYVCQQVSYGCQKVMLKHNIPVIFSVLTTDTEEQALARVGGAHGHKGHDCADTALEMISVFKQLKQ